MGGTSIPKRLPLKGELFWGIYRGPESQKNLLTLARLATNNLPVFHWLLEHGADPNIADGFDGTPMAYTAMNGTSYMIRQLFQYGAKVDNNALHHAVGRSVGRHSSDATSHGKIIKSHGNQ